jgi:hypothetical protein
MNWRGWSKKFLPTLGLVMISSPLAVQACSVCYGDPDSGQSKGLVWGIVTLLSVVVTVLGCVGSFFVYIAKKSPTDKSDDARNS